MAVVGVGGSVEGYRAYGGRRGGANGEVEASAFFALHRPPPPLSPLRLKSD